MSQNCLIPRMVSATFYFSLQLEGTYFSIFLLAFYGVRCLIISFLLRMVTILWSDYFQWIPTQWMLEIFLVFFALCFRAFVMSLLHFIWLHGNCVFIVSRLTYSHRRPIWESVGWGTIYLISRRYMALLFEKGPQQNLSQGSSTSVSMNPESMTVMSGPFMFNMINPRAIAF